MLISVIAINKHAQLHSHKSRLTPYASVSLITNLHHTRQLTLISLMTLTKHICSPHFKNTKSTLVNYFTLVKRQTLQRGVLSIHRTLSSLLFTKLTVVLRLMPLPKKGSLFSMVIGRASKSLSFVTSLSLILTEPYLLIYALSLLLNSVPLFSHRRVLRKFM